MIRKLTRDIDMFWPELRNQFPGFEKPIVIPARSITQEAPMYMRRYIDQDPDSYYIFIKGNVMNGDCSRDAATRFFFELMHEKLGLPSSYERDELLSPEMAVSKELLPADNDRQYKNFFEEQIDKMREAAAAEEKAAEEDEWEKKHGFRRDDPDIIDVDVDAPAAGAAAGAAAPGTAVGAAKTTAVGMPKPIFYAIDIHVPAGGALGWDGPAGRLGHRRGDERRGPRGFLREGTGWTKEQREKTLRSSDTEAAVLDDGSVWVYSDSVEDMLANIKKWRGKYGAAREMRFQVQVDPPKKNLDYMTSGVKITRFKVKDFKNGTATLTSGVGEGKYAALTLDEFIDQLQAAGVQKFSDVKALEYDGKPFIGWAQQHGGDMYDLVFGDPAKYDGRDADAAKAKIDGFLSEKDREDMLEEAVLTPDECDDIADMFASYGGPSSSWGSTDFGRFVASHAAELKAIANGSDQARSIGDLERVRDIGSDDEVVAEDLDGEVAPSVVKAAEALYEEDLNGEIGEIVGDSQEDQERENADMLPLPEDCVDEDDDALDEAFIRHSTMLAREVR